MTYDCQTEPEDVLTLSSAGNRAQSNSQNYDFTVFHIFSLSIQCEMGSN